MEHYNYKVVAELRPDLTELERETAVHRIKDLQQRLRIMNLDAITYCKEPPICGLDDFGAVGVFFAALDDMKDCFSRLEYYDQTPTDIDPNSIKLDISAAIRALRDEAWGMEQREKLKKEELEQAANQQEHTESGEDRTRSS